MNQFNFLKRLFDVQPDGSPFISLYLNTEPNETGKKDFNVFLKKQLHDHLAVIETGSEQQQHFQNAAERIQAFAETIDPATRGLAIFAGTGNNAFFETFEFQI